MKRYSIIALFVFCTVVSHAQTTDQLDTVRVRYPYYYYNFYDDHLSYGTVHDDVHCVIKSCYFASTYLTDSLVPWYEDCWGHLWLNHGSFYNELAIGFVPDSTLHVVGVAFMRAHNNPGLLVVNHWLNWTGDSTINSDVRCHFNVYGHDMQLVQTRTVPYGDLHPARVMLNGEEVTFEGHPYYPHFEPCYEVFFDSPMDISDTFYLSETVTYKDSVLVPDMNFVEESHYGLEDTTRFIFDSNCLYRMPVELRRYRNDIVNGAWESGKPFDGRMFNIYPIIERPGDTCGVVRSIRYDSVAPGFALLRWTALPNQTHWEVSYGPAGTAPGEGRVAETDMAQLSLVNLSPDTQYVAYVRARCKMARTVWTDWSDSTSICLGHGGQGMAEAEGLEARLDISPNPASGAATVHAEQGIRYIEVYDTRGARVYAASCDGQPATTLDSKAWPAGLYIVTVETSGGKASGMLTVKH